MKRLKLDTWISLGTGLLAIVSLLVSFWALRIAEGAFEAQRRESRATHVVSLYAKYEPVGDLLTIQPTEDSKTLHAAMVVFPSALELGHVELVAPENALEFGSFRESIQSAVFKYYELEAGELPSFGHYVRIPVPIGVMTISTHQGEAYTAASRYALLVGCDLSQAVRTSQDRVKVEFLALMHAGLIDLSGFLMVTAPWNKLSPPERDARIFERRTEEVRELVDSYWHDLGFVPAAHDEQ